MLPTTIISIALSTQIGRLAGRYGSRFFMLVGPIIGGIGFFLLLRITPSADYWSEVFPGIVVFGLGLTITVAPLTSAILGSIDQARAGIASAVNNAVSRVAGLISVAAAGLIVGSSLDVDGLHRAAAVTGVLLITGGLISGIGIVNPRRTDLREKAATTSGA
jgi:Na+/melibiose symporter-like transporter